MPETPWALQESAPATLAQEFADVPAPANTYVGGPLLNFSGAAVGAQYSITGAVSLSLTPSAAMLEGRGIVGAVTVTLTLAATMQEGRVIAGAVTVTLTPAAGMLEGRGIIGAAPLVLLPAAMMLYTSIAAPASTAGWGDPRLAKLLHKKRKPKPKRIEEPWSAPVFTLPEEDAEDWEAIVLALLN